MVFGATDGEPSRSDTYEQLAAQMFGGLPVGDFCGMPVLMDPTVPANRIRFVDPVSGRFSDFDLP